VKISRRQVLGGLGATVLSGALGRRAYGKPANFPGLGLNTWSLRYLTHDEVMPVIFAAMKQSGVTDCQLLYSHAEPSQFDPGFGAPHVGVPTPEQAAQAERKAAARNEWRRSVPLSYFEAIRRQFQQQGFRITAYIGPLPEDPAEVDRTLQIAKALGATLVNGRVKESQTDVVAAATQRHGVQVGIQVTDVKLLPQQLRASSWLRADPDIGDLTKAGVDALAFVREYRESIAAVDLKDAIFGGNSVPFGEGQSHMREVVETFKAARSPIDVYIDCDYPGTGRSADEIVRCARYVRGVMGS
jgi:sugar phosphate isomerase/epimerase